MKVMQMLKDSSRYLMIGFLNGFYKKQSRIKPSNKSKYSDGLPLTLTRNSRKLCIYQVRVCILERRYYQREGIMWETDIK